MFRLSKTVTKSLNGKIKPLRYNQASPQSSYPKSSGSGINKTAIATVGVISVTAGTIGYSSWSYENRKFVTDTIPGSDYVLSVILGPAIPPKNPESIKSTPQTKKAEPIKPKTSDSPTKTVPPLPPAPPLPQVTPVPEVAKKESKKEPNLTEKIEKVAKKESKKEPNLTEKIEKDKLIEKSSPVDQEKKASDENVELSKRVETVINEAQALISAALESSERAVGAVRSHAEKAYAAVDSGEGHESLYAMAAEVAKTKKELIDLTEEKLSGVKDKMDSLQDEIVKGKKQEATKNNESLSKAEEIIPELSYAISKIKSSLSEALRDSSVVNEFRELVEASRTQFEAEVRSLLPDVKIGEKSDKLTTDELNLLLAHAHRKVLALHKTLAKQQTIDKERFKESVLRQREMESKFIDGKMNAELERQRRDLGLEHRHRMQQLREDLESELRGQLKRQAAAHSDHLADVLDQQEKKLEEQWQRKVLDAVQAESDKYYQSLSKIQGQLSGLKMGLKSRADADRAAHSAHELWLACEALKTALRFGKENSSSWQDQLMPLSDHVKSIKNSTPEGDFYVSTVLSSVPEVALSRGVLTEEALKERFMKVDRVCRRVALIGDNGASLPRYLLSYLQSFFLVGAFDRIPESEMLGQEVDVMKLNTHDLLARARYCMAKGDLTQAVRYVNLLRGESRHAAADWLKEARWSLEARQAADALMAYAAATGARAL